MFDPQLTAAGWYLGDLNAEDLVPFACDALERGHDGKNLRHLAGLVNPTKRDVEEIVDAAFRELDVVVPLSKDDAAVWTLSEVKSDAATGDITSLNFVGKLLTTLPELASHLLTCLLK